MIVRLFLVVCIAAMARGGDQRSDLTLSRPVEANGHRDFVISVVPHKRVVVFIKDGAVTTLDVSADFPYSVTLTDSPTPRYKAVLVFEDRRKDVTTDSFGITSTSSLERTDDATHKALVESAAKGRAIGERLAKDIRDRRK
jgi:hypothetical protein